MKKSLSFFGLFCCLQISLFMSGSVLAAPVLSSAPTGSPPNGVLPLAARPAPSMVLKDIDGNRFDLAQAKGRWVFVHFWASWCGPCRREIPAIQRMIEKFPESPFELAIVNTAENEDTVFTFLGVLAPDIVPLLDSDGVVTEAWQPRGLPSTYLVDPAGNIRFQALGGRPWDTAPYVKFLQSLNK
jgi:thiol-disulfide isomerase/thioredoxin